MFPDMYLQYNHPTNKSQQKPFDKNRQSPTASTPAPIPHTLPAHHKKPQPPQPSSAALMAHHLPANHHTSHPQKTERIDCQRGGCMVGTRCVGVSRWSYLAPEASDGKVLCGHKPQSKPHLSEPGTHQRTWRVMGRPARQKTQTPSLTRRNDRTRHDHAAAPLADCPFVPPFVPPSPTQKKSPQVQTPRNSPKTQISNYHQSLPVVTNHHPTRSRNF